MGIVWHYTALQTGLLGILHSDCSCVLATALKTMSIPTTRHHIVHAHASSCVLQSLIQHLSGLQGLHSVAYTGALGRPLICPDGGTANLSADTLHEFVSSNFVAPKMVLAVAGTEHRALLELAEPMLNTVAGGSPPSQPASEYAGGDFR